MLPDAGDDELIVEKTPAYFVTMPYDLPYKIKKVMPNVKLILLLCDPVKRAFSDYAQRVNSLKSHHMVDVTKLIKYPPFTGRTKGQEG